MTWDELFIIALSNLWRTKLRTILTTLGVIIGIGALVSMVSFGTGMQKNMTDAFYENEVFTSLMITPQKIDFDKAMSGDFEGMAQDLYTPPPDITDSTLAAFQELPGVQLAFPETRIPVKLRWGENETKTTLRALPAEIGQYKPFNKLAYGEFFTSDSSRGVVLNYHLLKDLKILLMEENKKIALEDTLRGMQRVPSDSLIGSNITVISKVVDVSKMMGGLFGASSGKLPFKDVDFSYPIVGIRERGGAFDNSNYDSGIYLPIETAQEIPNTGFTDMWDVFSGKHDREGYGSVFVRVEHMKYVESIQDTLENMGYNVFSIMDQLGEMKKSFLIFDVALGAVGTIALIVAALGIINTMIMSILERTREIGIMKAIGGSEGQIKTIFFVEAGTIGLIGGTFGLGLGWIVTRIANAVANAYLLKEVEFHIDMFYIPVWLIAGALAFSILVSFLAGIYPAARAARISPVDALRHD